MAMKASICEKDYSLTHQCFFLIGFLHVQPPINTMSFAMIIIDKQDHFNLQCVFLLILGMVIK